MSTLTDDFLDDLEDLSDAEGAEEEKLDPNLEEDTAGDGGTSTEKSSSEKEVKKESVKEMRMQIDKPSILKNPAFLSHIETLSSTPLDASSHIKKCTEYLPLLTEEIKSSHSLLIDAYTPRFPTLHEIILNPSLYVSIVSLLGTLTDGNLSDDLKKHSEELKKILPPTNFMTLTVSSSMISCRALTPSESSTVNTHCTSINLSLKYHTQILQSLESITSVTAPNTSALLGPSVCAKILSLTGSVKNLSRIPSCNLQKFGSLRDTGVVNREVRSLNGVIMDWEGFKTCPEYLKGKIVKILSNKVTLCARIDASGTKSTSLGEEYYNTLISKIKKLDEPDKSQLKKSLPTPILASSKKRGGRKVRAAKKRFETGEIHALANKRTFGVDNGEYGDDAMGMDRGMLGKARTGVGAGVQVKGVKKQGLSMSKQAVKRRKVGGEKKDGFASSVVFSSHTGMELVGGTEDKVKKANEKWFGKQSGFKSAMPK
ncbi:hypothetical protein TrVE_jg11346 [Triparma verrucosa]|uniref:Nop domain-containing protein n=1 Tax=Triparma verrucosa TaxID=1606542 RepID=A0A9W7F9P8_9STRA|nr:hypothetical protein TrVE_jg11346 [Triparma verrucosa]